MSWSALPIGGIPLILLTGDGELVKKKVKGLVLPGRYINNLKKAMLFNYIN